jgi:ethanolamine utilization protein EutA
MALLFPPSLTSKNYCVDQHGIVLAVGDRADLPTLRKVCALMAEQLAQALHLIEPDLCHFGMYTNLGKHLPSVPPVRAVTYSGGVADYIYHEADRDLFYYGDIGILLGEAIRENRQLSRVERLEGAETIRATVVGAGTHTTEVSGSTITFARERLPMKNVPILKVPKEEETPARIAAFLSGQLPLYQTEGSQEQIAIAFEGNERYTFDDIQHLADPILEGARAISMGQPPSF